MLSSEPPVGNRNLAAKAFRKAGLIDEDERMRDVADKPGGRKAHVKGIAHKNRSSHRPRAIEAVMGKDQAGSSSRSPMVNQILLFSLSLL
jgi:nuclear RNA export factor